MNSMPTIGDLAEIMGRVFGNPDLPIGSETVAVQVPGWDSLSHVVLMMEIEGRYGVLLQPAETAELPNVGALLILLLERLK
jgi:acyl carrier protein